MKMDPKSVGSEQGFVLKYKESVKYSSVNKKSNPPARVLS